MLKFKFLKKVSKYLKNSQNNKNLKLVFGKWKVRGLKFRFCVLFEFQKFEPKVPKFNGIPKIYYF
jgi:hypothetical protein